MKMAGKETDRPEIMIGVDLEQRVATVSPPARVVEAGAHVTFRLRSDVNGSAILTFPAEGGRVARVDQGRCASVLVTRTGVYFVVVLLENGKPLGTMAVLILDP